MSNVRLSQYHNINTGSHPNPPFDIATVSYCLWDSSYVVGSYDGRVAKLFSEKGSFVYDNVTLLAKSGEAINSILRVKGLDLAEFVAIG